MGSIRDDVQERSCQQTKRCRLRGGSSAVGLVALGELPRGLDVHLEPIASRWARSDFDCLIAQRGPIDSRESGASRLRVG